MNEAEYYPYVATWAEKRLGCFVTQTNTGLRHGRIDVVGLRDAGGRLSGRSEVISLEVKRGTQPFATSVGQAAGYAIYADRTYLAEFRPRGFSDQEKSIAAHLGVGLVRISGTDRVRIAEELTAPLREPLEGLRLEVIERTGYSQCTLCRSLFRRREERPMDSVVKFSDSGKHVARALADEKGLLYWLWEQDARSGATVNRNYFRRYLCADCVAAVFTR